MSFYNSLLELGFLIRVHVSVEQHDPAPEIDDRLHHVAEPRPRHLPKLFDGDGIRPCGSSHARATFYPAPDA
jgi:hypothetical protein